MFRHGIPGTIRDTDAQRILLPFPVIFQPDNGDPGSLDMPILTKLIDFMDKAGGEDLVFRFRGIEDVLQAGNFAGKGLVEDGVLRFCRGSENGLRQCACERCEKQGKNEHPRYSGRSLARTVQMSRSSGRRRWARVN